MSEESWAFIGTVIWTNDGYGENARAVCWGIQMPGFASEDLARAAATTWATNLPWVSNHNRVHSFQVVRMS